ncbi:ATP-binding protein [Tistrella bauzanensis]|uniref:histidine kinase n=1 Tax=Tistrella arctica TaxID=3133430 RepID=A0ABU9YIC7_9PROT
MAEGKETATTSGVSDDLSNTDRRQERRRDGQVRKGRVRDDGLAPDRLVRRSREGAWIGVIAVVGIVLSIGAWSITRHDRILSQRQAFSEAASATAAAMAIDIDRHIGAALDLAALFASSNRVEDREFERFVTSFRRRAPALSMMAWYSDGAGEAAGGPLRLPDQVALGATRLRLVNASGDADGADEILPADPGYLAMLVERALFSGALAVEPVGHADPTAPVTGLVFALPLRAENRPDGIDIVIGVIDAGVLVADVRQRITMASSDRLSLRPVPEPADPRPIGSAAPAAGVQVLRMIDQMPTGADPQAWVRTRNLAIGDRLFKIKVAAGADAPGRWIIEMPALAVLLAGLGFTAVVAILLFRARRRARLLENLRADNLESLDQLEREVGARRDTEYQLVDMVNRLGASERGFRSTFDLAAVGIAHLTTEGVIERANSRFARILGTDNSAIVDASIMDFVHPEGRATWTDEFRALVGGAAGVMSTEQRFITRAGISIWLRITANLADDGTGGRVIMVIDDVTEHTVMMRRLSLSERSLASAQRVAGLGIVEWDPQTNAVWWSAETYRLFARPPTAGPLPFEAMAEYVVAEDMALLDRAIAHTVETGKPLRMDLRIRQLGEEPRWLRVEGAMESDGRRRVLLAALLDATADRIAANTLRRAKEQAEAANEAKSIFLANMSHELRTPLNAVIGFAEAMLGGLGGLPNDRHRLYLTDIQSAGRHLLAVIGSILDLSKIEAGKARLDEAHADLGAIAREAARLVTPQAEHRDIGIVLDIPEPAPMVIADRLKLRQLVLNLISNAVKFSDPGGVVTVGVRRRPEGGVVIEVVDDGIGMEPDQIATALLPFEQLASAHGRGGGTGLGLPLARAIADLHGGRLDIDSRPGIGTRVGVSLPLDRVLALDGDVEPPARTPGVVPADAAVAAAVDGTGSATGPALDRTGDRRRTTPTVPPRATQRLFDDEDGPDSSPPGPPRRLH